MGDLKIPVALIFTMILQAIGLVYWVSQQAATIDQLKEDMVGVASRMAIEDQINLKRDVQRHAEEIEGLWEASDSNAMHMERIVDILRRVSLLEQEVNFIGREIQDIKRANSHPLQ